MKDEGNTTKKVSPWQRLHDRNFELALEREQLKHRLAVTESNLKIAEGKCDAFKLMVHKLESRHEGYCDGIKDTITLLRPLGADARR